MPLQANFTTCDFKFVEEMIAKAEGLLPKRAKISPITCDVDCASQWFIVSNRGGAGVPIP